MIVVTPIHQEQQQIIDETGCGIDSIVGTGN